jgi:N utilization substance protein A
LCHPLPVVEGKLAGIDYVDGNVRLAARLTGWKIDIKDAAKYDHAAESAKIQAQIEAAQFHVDVEEDNYEDDDDYEDEGVEVSLPGKVATEDEET